MASSARRIGILAGGGSLPREIADSAAARGAKVQIVAIDGEADADFGAFPVERVNWGQIGRMLGAFKRAGASDLVIVGRVRRPDLFRLKPDWGLIRSLPAIFRVVAAGGDDDVLRRVIRFFEGYGFRVVGPQSVAPELIIGAGAFAGLAPSPEDERDIKAGFDVVRALGPYDVGQAVVVTGGLVEAVEGADGTDAMLARIAQARRERGQDSKARRGVLVKLPKPSQELRIDLPVIGPETVTRAAEAGLSGIAVLAGHVLAVHRGELIERAKSAAIFVEGVPAGPEAATPSQRRPRTAQADPSEFTRLGSRSPDERSATDARKGGEVLHVLQPSVQSRLVVVIRGHVLAVEAGEGVRSLLQRAAGLRQWGSARVGRRAGVAVFAQAPDLDPEAVAKIASAGIAGIAILGAEKRQLAPGIMEAIEDAKLFLVGVTARH